MKRVGPFLFVCCLIGLVAAASASAAPELNWERCGKHAQCATASLPRDYSDPSKGTVEIALSRVPATNPDRRIGSLFTNYGGPGFGDADIIQHSGHKVYRRVNRRYDLIGFDPRGTGGSRPALNCHLNGERESKPLPTPSTPRADLVRGSEGLIHRCQRFMRHRHILRYVTTGNAARDLDQLRAAVGDAQLNYLGYSYGTVLGSTYQALFPDRVGRMLLDGPVDLHDYFQRPTSQFVKQAASSQDVLEGFLRACKRHQDACSNFGDGHPSRALADLFDEVSRHPLPADEGDRLDSDDLLAGVNWDVYGRQYWNELAAALRDAEQGDGTFLKALADFWWGKVPGGGHDPGVDANLLITTVDQAWPKAVPPYLDAIRRSYRASKYLWWIGGSTSGFWGNVINGLYPVRPNGVYRGPFENPASAPTTLVVATTHDPLTPYEGAKAEVRQLGNARLLTMKGYTHTAYPDASPCIARKGNAYLLRGVLPAEGTTCRQQVAFERYSAKTAKLGAAVSPARQARLVP